MIIVTVQSWTFIDTRRLVKESADQIWRSCREARNPVRSFFFFTKQNWTDQQSCARRPERVIATVKHGGGSRMLVFGGELGTLREDAGDPKKKQIKHATRFRLMVE